MMQPRRYYGTIV
jgi:hypothetical protein